MLDWSTWWYPVVAFIAATCAGAINAVAGGGTNLSFPTLLWLGVPPVQANATNLSALWAGTWTSAWGFRREIRRVGRFWHWSALAALAGGGVGAIVLVSTPPEFFQKLAPFLVLASTLLIGAKPLLDRYLSRSKPGRPRWLSWIAVLAIFTLSIYGGYFGAGMGLLLIVALSLAGLTELHVANGIKNLYQVAIQGTAAVYFAATGNLKWGYIAVMAVGALIGGYIGGTYGHKLGEHRMRWLIVAIGLAMATIMFLRSGDGSDGSASKAPAAQAAWGGRETHPVRLAYGMQALQDEIAQCARVSRS